MIWLVVDGRFRGCDWYVCMYVCMYVCICVYMCVCLCVCLCVNIRVFADQYLCVCVCVCVFACSVSVIFCMRMYIYRMCRPYFSVFVSVRINAYKRTYTHNFRHYHTIITSKEKYVAIRDYIPRNVCDHIVMIKMVLSQEKCFEFHI